ncbi:MAG: photosystem reaction center subunit [Hyphomicrobiales bacterium]|jgi:sporulation protein YlmC with PRC-barrel domain|nr:photosystem reaction center subunit [Hyphomicrobiales bacterium]
MKKYIAAACLLGTALSAPAFAQDSSSSASPPMSTSGASSAGGQFMTQMGANEWRGSKLVGVDVYGSDNSKIGDINEVIVDRNGQAKAIVIGIGGFLGIGEKNVAIPWDKVQWNIGGNQSSGSMASGASSGGQPAGDRSTPRDIAQTTTGSPSDPNAQPPQAAATGGATLSSAPSSGTDANAPANSSASVTSAPSTSTGSSSGSSSGSRATAAASTGAHDYPDRALVSMSKQDLQNAPDFKYASQSNAGSGAASSGSTGSSSGR